MDTCLWDTLYFKKYEVIFKGELDAAQYLKELPDTERNIFYSTPFAHYILNIWCEILPIWTSVHLGDQGQHGTSAPYSE